MAEESSGIGSGPEKLIFIELIAVGPAVATGWREWFESEIVISFLAQIGKEAVENLRHCEEGGAEVPAEALCLSFCHFAADRGVFFEKGDPTTGTAEA
jgi:hypothetical protein